jgi:hypothetical protein
VRVWPGHDWKRPGLDFALLVSGIPQGEGNL